MHIEIRLCCGLGWMMGLCSFVKRRLRNVRQLKRARLGVDFGFLHEEAWLRLSMLVGDFRKMKTTRSLDEIQVQLVILQMEDLKARFPAWKKHPEKLLNDEHVAASPFTFLLAMLVLLCDDGSTGVRDHAPLLRRCLQAVEGKDPFKEFMVWLEGSKMYRRSKPRWRGMHESLQLPGFPMSEPVDQQPPSLHGACISLRRGEGDVALEILEKAVPLGCACYWMGRVLYYGEAGIVRDESRALTFFRAGVARGCLKSLNELGAYHYRRRKEASWRYNLAIRCFNIGVTHQDPAAHLLKGLVLLDQNQSDHAWRFITKAAHLGSLQACIYVDQFKS
ncbi:hypothetical protein DSO57_1037533 [Entomophthora muscae]|uniref:Uncharacterized protein n=1 Tax=Entomophthora muscae TaxID=34485 RepID=A0ACC2RPX5_9FUNG|nr:hypothetical protein DSO57_1037533 [Entomophthora muscae]